MKTYKINIFKHEKKGKYSKIILKENSKIDEKIKKNKIDSKRKRKKTILEKKKRFVFFFQTSNLYLIKQKYKSF